MKFTCTCGKDSKEFIKKGTLADEKRVSGFECVLTHEMRTLWFCPECFDRVRCLAKEIIAIVQDKNIYFPNLLKEKK
jgi:hypothetical protein